MVSSSIFNICSKTEFSTEESSGSSIANCNTGLGTSSTTGYGTNYTAGLHSSVLANKADSRSDNNHGKLAKSSTFAPIKSEFQIEERNDNSGENRDIGSGTSSTTGYGIIGTHCTAGLYSFHNADSRVDNNHGRSAKPSIFASILIFTRAKKRQLR